MIPDVTSFRLETARKLLDEFGLTYALKETVPVRLQLKGVFLLHEDAAALRVIRQKIVDDSIVELVVAREIAPLS